MKFDDLLRELPDKRSRIMFDHARTAALSSCGIGRGSYRVGAVICDKRNIISAGYNSYKSHPLLKEMKYPCLHAETSAIFKAGIQNTTGLNMYICRIWKDGSTIGLSKPCSNCMGFINMAKLNSVIYTTYEGYGKLQIL